MNSDQLSMGDSGNSVSLREQEGNSSNVTTSVPDDISRIEIINSNVLLENRQRSVSINLLDDMISTPFQPPDGERSIFSTISVPGLHSSLDQDGDSRKFFEHGERMDSQNAQTLQYKQRIEILEKKLKALYVENENLKMELRLLKQVSQSNPPSSGRPTRYWTAAEHKRFLEAIQIFGEDNKSAISMYVGSRSVNQIRSHMQKFKKRMERVSSEPPTGLNKSALNALQSDLDSHLSKSTDKSSLFEDVIPDEEVRFVTPLNAESLPSGKVTTPEVNSGNNNDEYNPFSSCVVC